MKYISPLVIPFYLAAISSLMGCMSYTTLQTAETLSPGQIQGGAGAVITTEGNLLPELSARIGIIDNLDLGVKYSLITLVMVDAKYQFLNSGVNGAIDFGCSHSSNIAITTMGYYPMILFGQRHWYVGVKGNYFSTTGSIELFGANISFNGSGYTGTSIITGGMLGNDAVRLLIELNTIISVDRTVTKLPAVGLYFGF